MENNPIAQLQHRFRPGADLENLDADQARDYRKAVRDDVLGDAGADPSAVGEDLLSVVDLLTKEIGLRMAIGAQPRDVLTLIVGGGMKLAVLGIIVGTLGAFAASSLVETMLFEVEPTDPVSYAATAGLLLVIAALACYIPARRAMRVDPMVALQD